MASVDNVPKSSRKRVKEGAGECLEILPEAKRTKLPAAPPWLYVENVIPQAMHDRLLDACMVATSSLQAKHLKILGRSIEEPRLTQLYTTDAHDYTYAGLKHTSRLFTEVPELEEVISFVRDWIEAQNLPHPVPDYNTALVNHYRAHTPNDGVMKHSDKDGVGHTIASISLGGVRRFNIYQNTTTKSGKVGCRLVEHFYIQPRSVLLMFPGMQSEYKHEVVKPGQTRTKDPVLQAQLDAARINITLREQ